MSLSIDIRTSKQQWTGSQIHSRLKCNDLKLHQKYIYILGPSYVRCRIPDITGVSIEIILIARFVCDQYFVNYIY